MNLPIKAIHHIAIKTNDLERLNNFYQNLFGKKEDDIQFDDNKNPRAYWYRLDQTILMIEKHDIEINSQRSNCFCSFIFDKERRSTRLEKPSHRS